MWKFPLLAEFIGGCLDAHLEGLLLEIRNLYDVLIYGDDAKFFSEDLAP